MTGAVREIVEKAEVNMNEIVGSFLCNIALDSSPSAIPQFCAQAIEEVWTEESSLKGR